MTKRILMSILAMGIIALMVSSASFALFRDSSTNSGNQFTTGEVSLNGSSADALINLDTLLPGDNNTGSTYTWTVQYTGNVKAYLDVTASATFSDTYGGATPGAGDGIPDIINCDTNHPFSLKVNGTDLFSAAGYTGGQDIVTIVDPAVDDTTSTYEVTYSWPSEAGNVEDLTHPGQFLDTPDYCFGNTVALHLSAKAVQYRNNDNGANPTSW